MKLIAILKRVNSKNKRGTLNNTNSLHRSRKRVTMSTVNSKGGKENHRAVMYLRVASQDHDDQREACTREAERRGVSVIAKFTDTRSAQ